MNKVLIGAFSLVAATALTACGSSNNAKSAGTTPTPTAPNSPAASSPALGGSDAAVAAQIKAELLKSQSTDSPFKVTDSEAGCVANAAVSGIGLDKLRAYGVLTADNKLTGKKLTSGIRLSTADATVVVNAFFTCVGDTQFATFFKQEVTSKLPASLTAAQRSCFEGKITVDAVKRLAIADLTGDTAATTQFETSLEACMR